MPDRIAKLIFTMPVVGSFLRRLSVGVIQVKNIFVNPFMNYIPADHFYSPLPSIKELKANEESIFGIKDKQIPGIDLNEELQLELMGEFKKYYDEMPFPANKEDKYRYFFENDAYCYSDGTFLHSMMRYFKPKRMIEVGSGFSSCNILDTNEYFFDSKIALTFVEPYPAKFYANIRPDDRKSIVVHENGLSDVPLSVFEELEKDDILFIDSTHISKTGSDVNYIIFDIFPVLKPGVIIHVHDIYFPFEYPKEHIYKGIAWNEAYMLRAFLQFNDKFEILFFNTFMEHFHKDLFEKNMPKCLLNSGGSIWLRKKG